MNENVEAQLELVLTTVEDFQRTTQEAICELAQETKTLRKDWDSIMYHLSLFNMAIASLSRKLRIFMGIVGIAVVGLGVGTYFYVMTGLPDTKKHQMLLAELDYYLRTELYTELTPAQQKKITAIYHSLQALAPTSFPPR